MLKTSRQASARLVNPATFTCNAWLAAKIHRVCQFDHGGQALLDVLPCSRTLPLDQQQRTLPTTTEAEAETRAPLRLQPPIALPCHQKSPDRVQNTPNLCKVSRWSHRHMVGLDPTLQGTQTKPRTSALHAPVAPTTTDYSF
jgi:hypothetical protein